MVSQSEIDYLLAVIMRWFDVELTSAHSLRSFAGVKPLYDDKNEKPSAVTRDYVFDN